jgi:glycerol-3-phosphate dehydrogenase
VIQSQGVASFDLCVIGAGIHGVGVAQAAAVNGLSVLLIERHQEAAMETSRSSSKLIHGGLRYLETAQFKLVYECLGEQQVLQKIAPHLVKLQPFYIPVYRQSMRSTWWIYLGLLCYRLLTGWRSDHPVVRVPSHEWSNFGIQQHNLRGLFGYFDAQTDDRLLTLAVLSSAQKLGAEVFFNCKIDQCGRQGSGYALHLSNGKKVFAKSIANAGGPWANEVAQKIDESVVPFDWVQGTHIVLDQPSFKGCFYVEAPSDGRAVFILPWKGLTLVGTTELLLTQPNAKPTESEIDYLLGAYNHHFPNFVKNKSNICEVFCGVRVLPKGTEKTTGRPRETLLVRNFQGNYVGIYGGKLTSYRLTAEKVVKILLPIFGKDQKSFISTQGVML